MLRHQIATRGVPAAGVHGTSASRVFASLVGVFSVALGLGMLGGCKHSDSAAEATPPMPQVVNSGETGTVQIAQPQRFPVAYPATRTIVPSLNVTGVVSPDVSREIPVLSLANGRVVALHVELGDRVRKGQLVMEVQSPDVSTAFGTYLKAVADEHLTAVTLTRDKLLYSKGAVSQSQLQIAQNGDDDARADLTASQQQLHILGVDPKHPGENVRVYAPATGVVISQNVTAAGAAGINYSGPGGSLLIADLSHVWVICDVYENDLARVHLGEHATVRVNSYPGQSFSGTISDIGAALDPGLRTAKVRIQVPNPGGELRLGMFATASLEGTTARQAMVVPSTAVLQLHDRSYVYVTTPQRGVYRRLQVQLGAANTDNTTEVTAGLGAAQQVVTNALELQNTVDAQ